MGKEVGHSGKGWRVNPTMEGGARQEWQGQARQSILQQLPPPPGRPPGQRGREVGQRAAVDSAPKAPFPCSLLGLTGIFKMTVLKRIQLLPEPTLLKQGQGGGAE